jgi:guanylate kinase
LNTTKPNPILIVLSGPSGVGKDAVLSRMKEHGLPLYFVVTATTRPQRNNETDGKDYIFLSQSRFQEMIRSQDMLEWAEVYGNFYGVPKSQTVSALEKGQDVIIKVDVQGANTIRSIFPQAVFIFLAPPDLDELAERLKNRMSESRKALKVRLATASKEMDEMPKFDYVVTNYRNHIDKAVLDIESIIASEKSRIPPKPSPLTG